MSRVLLENVYKSFGPIEAVIDVNLEIKDQEFVVLVGPSGCGKTTTLRMIAGLEDVSKGTIHIEDRIVNDIHPKDRDIAMVFQNYALYPHMTVYENMAFGLKLRKTDKKEIKKRVEEASEILDLGGLLDRKPKHLSGGQRQRVALGRAIVRHPKVFLMDEPLSNLDAKLRVQTRGQLKKLHERLKATIIYVTHDQVEAMTLGNRIVIMKSGKIQQVDTPINSYDNPSNLFVAGFIGSPAMNFIDGSLSKQDRNIIFNANNANFSINIGNDILEEVSDYIDKDLVLGIRPEHIFTEDRAKRKGMSNEAISVKVEFTELLGAENYAHCFLDNQKIITRYDPHLTISMGDQLKLVLDPKKIRLFDNESKQVII